MTRERLRSFSMRVLREIAEKEGFKGASAVGDREEIIDFILESMADSRIERAVLNNAAMKLKGNKYDIFQDEQLVSSEKEIYPIPDRYNETKIVLLLRDPQWAYAYWDVNDQDAESLRKDVFFEGFFLRAYEQNNEKYSDAAVEKYFDIPISETDESRYINLLHGGKWYSLGLFVMVHNKEKLLARSNTVKSPLGYLAENYEAFLQDPEAKEIILSSLWNYQKSGENTIPQRIIAIMDNQHMKLKI